MAEGFSGPLDTHLVRLASKSPFSCLPPASTVTSSSSPLLAVTTTFFSGRTLPAPLAGLIVISGAGVAGALVPPSAPGPEGLAPPPPEHDTVSRQAVTTASPAIGVLRR